MTLFNKRHVIVVGKQGVSHCFMVGVSQIPDPKEAHNKLEQLRSDLLSDPYFKGVPSMQSEAKKTAICFHAKDDLQEVRREVFKLLPTLNAKVQVAIRRKQDLAVVAQSNYRLSKRKTKDTDIYYDLVKRLFKNLLHKHDENKIIFASRGKSDRHLALNGALERAKKNFEITNSRSIQYPPTSITSTSPSASAGLQIIDYYLWALQRLYERGEDRFFQLLANQYRLIMDLDDKRNRPYGEWYSDSNRLELQKIKPVTG